MNECLSENQIDHFLADGLSDAEEQSLSDHLQQCAACRELLNQKTAIPDSLQQALSDDTKGEARSGNTDLDDLLARVRPAPTVDGVRLDGETQSPAATIDRDGGQRAANGAHTASQTELPGYELIEELGRGGLGIVFKARQVALDRIVAVKMMLPRTLPGPNELARFRVEAEAVAKLQHPNVVQVFDIIEREDNPCLSMEYVAGGNLAQRLDGKPQPPETAAKLVEILARAIHSVHEAGILHRDLKPANILLAASEADGGVCLTGNDGESDNVQPKITDFGLAKQVGQDSGMTDTQTALGTPSYMSPEQTRAAKDVTRAADIYSLGAILYETLVGRPPFRGSSVVETMTQVMHEEPVPPRRLVNTISVDLDAVCLKCLDKDAARRYSSAEELADDLHRVQDGRPTIARPITSTERVWRWCRRNPVVTSLVALALFLLLAGTGISTAFGVRALQTAESERHERQRADREAEEAEASRRQAEEEAANARQKEREANDAAYVSAMRLVQVAWESGNRFLAGRQLGAHIKSDDGYDRRGFEWYFWRNLERRHEDLLRIPGETAGVHQITFCSDGSRLASVDHDGALYLWDAEARKLLRTIRAHKGPVRGIRFSAEGKQITTFGMDDHMVKVWDVDSGELRCSLEKPEFVLNAWFSAMGKCFAAVRVKQGVEVWDVAAGQLAHRLEGLKGSASKLFFGVGDVLLVDSRGDGIRLFDASTGKQVQTFSRSGIHRPMGPAAFSPDGKFVAAAIARRIHVWERKTGQLVHFLPPGDQVFNALQFAPDSKHIVTQDTKQKTRIWAIGEGGVLFGLPEETLRLKRSSVAFSEDGRWFAEGIPTAGKIKMWDATEFPAYQELDLVGENLDADFSGTARRIAFAKDTEGVEVLRWPTRKPVFQQRWPDERAFRVALSEDGNRLAAEVGTGKVIVLNLQTPDAEPLCLGQIAGSVKSLCFSPDGESVAAASADKAYLWDADMGNEIRTLEGHAQPLNSVAFHPSGEMIATSAMSTSGMPNSSVFVWDVKAGEKVFDLTRKNHPVSRVCFTPDGSSLALAGGYYVELYDVKTQSRTGRFEGHSSFVTGMSFSPDGRRLATSSTDETVKIWDVKSAQVLLTLRGHENGVERVAFSGDGTRLFSKSARQLIVWRAPRR